MKFVTPPPPPPPYPPPNPPPTPPKGSHFMNSGHLWKYQWRKGFVKVNRSPYLHRRIYRTLWKRELLRAWSLVILWKVGCCGTQYFDFLSIAFTDILIKLCGIWLIPPTHPPLNLQSIFFSPPLNSVRDGWFPHCSPWEPCNPPSPLKKFFLSDTLGNKNDSSFSISNNPKIKPETIKLP